LEAAPRHTKESGRVIDDSDFRLVEAGRVIEHDQPADLWTCDHRRGACDDHMARAVCEFCDIPHPTPP
jgi:hypothetical protein